MAKAEHNLAQFEMLVLLAVMRLKADDRHLSKIVIELEDGTSRWITPASVFTSLISMKKKGYLTAREEQCLNDPGLADTGEVILHTRREPFPHVESKRIGKPFGMGDAASVTPYVF